MRFNIYEHTMAWLRSQNLKVFAEPVVGSTNDLAKHDAFSVSNPIVVYVTDQQTKGRGRHERTWTNPNPGDSLMISFSLDPQGAPQPITSPLVGLAVHDALQTAFPTGNFSLKAPNDIYLESKKLAGILVEVSQMGDAFRLVIGMGLNVFSSPAEVETATSLSAFNVTRVAWDLFLQELLVNLQTVARSTLGTHLSELQRRNLLEALNKNPKLKEKLDQVSPFGDLVSKSGTQPWRTL